MHAVCNPSRTKDHVAIRRRPIKDTAEGDLSHTRPRGIHVDAGVLTGKWCGQALDRYLVEPRSWVPVPEPVRLVVAEPDAGPSSHRLERIEAGRVALPSFVDGDALPRGRLVKDPFLLLGGLPPRIALLEPTEVEDDRSTPAGSP